MAEDFTGQITREIRAAEEARRTGNEGRARVCARRATGWALAWFLTSHPRPAWKSDALSRLLAAGSDPDFPAGVQEACLRLAARVTGSFQYPAGADPIADATLVITHISLISGVPHP